MSEQPRNSLEERSRAVFEDSVANLDFALRSRLTQARHGALEAASRPRRAGLFRFGLWTPATGVGAAVLLGAALWLGSPLGHQSVTSADNQSSLEDLEIVASADEGSGDAMEMLQDDIDFYSWVDKAGSSDPSA